MGLHFVMFLPTLRNQCDPQQSRKWLPLAESFQALGTYAQTELGHGQSWIEPVIYALVVGGPQTQIHHAVYKEQNHIWGWRRPFLEVEDGCYQVLFW